MIRISIVLLILSVVSLFYTCSNQTKAEKNKKTGLSAERTTKDIAAQRDLRELILSDPHRPIYHFVNPEGRGMPFDPNGAIFWNGKYHLFYIFQDHRGHCWGHASSKDLLHWRIHTTALYPGENDVDSGIFSGNCFINIEGELGCQQRFCTAIKVFMNSQLTDFAELGISVRPLVPFFRAQSRKKLRPYILKSHNVCT